LASTSTAALWLAVLAVFVAACSRIEPVRAGHDSLMMGFVAGRRDGKPGVLRAFGCRWCSFWASDHVCDTRE